MVFGFLVIVVAVDPSFFNNNHWEAEQRVWLAAFGFVGFLVGAACADGFVAVGYIESIFLHQKAKVVDEQRSTAGH